MHISINMFKMFLPYRESNIKKIFIVIFPKFFKYSEIYFYIQGVRFVRDQTKSDDRLGQTKKKSPVPFCKIRYNY